MAYFIGKGYSDGFTASMAALLGALKPDSVIRLTVGTDAVCAACPNNRQGICDTADLVEDYDRAVLRLCDLRENEILSFGDFTALVQERILSPGLRPSVCGGCQWNEICSNQTSRWMQK